MREIRIDVRVSVTAWVGTGEELLVAVTVVAPADLAAGADPTVFFGYPGGGYSRSYYDLEVDGGGYSQAAYHAASGAVFVACDHVGVGGSSVPVIPLDHEAVGRGCAGAAHQVMTLLRAGSLDPRIPPIAPSAAVAMGQSYGGLLLTLAQATARPFDAVAFLGWSGLATRSPWPPGFDQSSLTAGLSSDANPRRRLFHLADVPEALVIADLTRPPGRVGSAAPWGSQHYPGGPELRASRDPLAPGVVASEAAAIDVPVFVGCGSTDVIEDPWAEPTAYRGSRDVTVVVVPGMGHMHNFAGTRHQMWGRLAGWAVDVSRRARTE